MNPLNKFYVPAPQDDRWSPGRPKTVIETVEIETGSSLKVIAPAFYAKDCPTVRKGGLLECSGPARNLTNDEYIELVHSLIPDHPLPRGYKPKITELFQATVEKKPETDHVKAQLPDQE
jgi:hypothetical protein